MKTTLVALALTAAVVATPALSLSYVDAQIVSVDKKSMSVTLSDKSKMQLTPTLDSTTIPVGQKVRIYAEVDEDGFEPITKIDAAE